MSPEIIINDEGGKPLVSVHISRDVAMATAVVLTREVGSPKTSFSEELAGLRRIANAFDIAARHSGKEKSKKNP